MSGKEEVFLLLCTVTLSPGLVYFQTLLIAEKTPKNFIIIIIIIIIISIIIIITTMYWGIIGI